MAQPYPEGEVFFKRSALRVTDIQDKAKVIFDPEHLADFASHVLIEYVYNESHKDLQTGKRFGSDYAEFRGKRRYYLKHFNVMFSNNGSPQRPGEGSVKINGHYKINSPTDDEIYNQKAHGGGPSKVAIVPVPITKGAKYMYIDLLVPIRAIYLPLAQKVSNIYPDLCTYVMVNFRARGKSQMLFSDRWWESGAPKGEPILTDEEVEVLGKAIGEPGLATAINLGIASRGTNTEGWLKDKNVPQEIADKVLGKYVNTHPQHGPQVFDNDVGLGYQFKRTAEIDMRGVYNLLIVPRQMRSRDKGLFRPRNPNDTLIKNHNYEVIDSFNSGVDGNNVVERGFHHLDYADVINSNFGVNLTWQPFEYEEETRSFISQLFRTTGEVGLNFIPIIGPIASYAFGVFMDVIEDPEAWVKENFLDLEGDALKSIAESAVDVGKNLAKRKGRGLGKVAKAIL